MAGRNYYIYISGMEKALDEKLFFLEEINLDDYDKVIDFGCGSGDVLAYIHKIKPTMKLIGIDSDVYMQLLTKQKVPTAEIYSELKKKMLNSKTLIVFNSVLHEVEDYWVKLKEIISGSRATIAVRDMRYRDFDYPESSIKYTKVLLPEDLAKVIKYSNPTTLAEFVEKYGMYSYEDLYHYLLKYSYVDNWDLELEENYFSFNWQDLESLGTIIYKKEYTLNFKREQVKKDFDIDMTCATHCKLILKLNKE